MKKVIQIIVYQILFVMLWFSLIRLAFFLIYFDLFRDHTAGEIISAFLSGLKFDFTAVGFFYGLINLPLFLPFGFFRRRLYLQFTAVVGLLVLLALFYIQAADLGFYREVGRRLGHELFGMVNDIPQMAQTVLKQEPLLSGLYVVINFLLCGAWYFLWKKILPSAKAERKIRTNWWAPAYSLLYLVLLTIGIRGGFQPTPLFIGDAFATPYLELGHLTLNGPFTSLRHLEEPSGEVYRWMPEKESQKIVRDMIRTPGDEFVSDKYTFFRKNTAPEKPIKKKNVIILIMESWSAYLLDVGRSEKDQIFPFLNKLKNKSLYFDQFYANGTRSIEGLVAVLYGMAANPDFTFIFSPYGQNPTISIPQIYNYYGYNTKFIFGIFPGSFNMHELARKAGFNEVVTQNDMPGYEKNSDSVWGVWDGFSLDYMIEAANKTKPPFMFTYFSVTTHSPWELPDENPDYFVFKEEKDYKKNVFRYSDKMLEKFLEKASKQPWYKDTIFVLTADHATAPFIDPYQKSLRALRRTPLVIFDPSGEIKPKIDTTTVGSQVDILPTLMNYHGFKLGQNSMGKDLLQPADYRFAVTASNGEIFFINNKRSYTLFKDKPLKMFDLNKDPSMEKGEKVEETGEIADELRKYRAYLQESNNAIVKNRLAPFEYYRSLNQ